MANSFVFWPYFGLTMTTPGEALPMGPQSSSLCFWNQWIKRNENSQLAKSKFNFLIFCPPVWLSKVLQVLYNNIIWLTNTSGKRQSMTNLCLQGRQNHLPDSVTIVHRIQRQYNLSFSFLSFHVFIQKSCKVWQTAILKPFCSTFKFLDKV